MFGDGCTHTRTRRDPRRPEVPYQNTIIYGRPRRLPSVCVLARCFPATSGSLSPTTPRSSPSSTRTRAARCRLDRHWRSTTGTATTENRRSSCSSTVSRKSPEASRRMLDLGEIARLPPTNERGAPTAVGREACECWSGSAASRSGSHRAAAAEATKQKPRPVTGNADRHESLPRIRPCSERRSPRSRVDEMIPTRHCSGAGGPIARAGDENARVTTW
jgi:hypothetical protein